MNDRKNNRREREGIKDIDVWMYRSLDSNPFLRLGTVHLLVDVGILTQ